MVPDWHPELYKLLWSSFWIKALFASLLSTGSKSRPARGLPLHPMLPKSRSQGGRENPSAARRRPGGPREALPFPEPKTPRPGPPYLSCREEAAVVLSNHGGHTLVPARQRVLSPAIPPHFGVETEPEFLVVPLHTRPENPPERSAPGAGARDRLAPRPGAAQGTCLRPRRRLVPLSGRPITHRPARSCPAESKPLHCPLLEGLGAPIPVP